MAYDFKTIPNVTLYWAVVTEPRENFNKTGKEYSVNCLVSKADMLKMKAAKVNKVFKSVDDEPGLLEKYPDCAGKYLLKLSMPAVNSKGSTNYPEVTLEGTEEYKGEIGNGSVGDVTVLTYEGQGMSSGKLNIRLHSISVTDLKVYEGGEPGEVRASSF